MVYILNFNINLKNYGTRVGLRPSQAFSINSSRGPTIPGSQVYTLQKPS